MKQDINTPTDGIGSFTADQGVPVLGLKSNDEYASTVGANVVSDPLFKALELAPYEGLKDWLKTDLRDHTARAAVISPEMIRAKRAVEAALAEAELEIARFAANREVKSARQNLQALKMTEGDSQSVKEASTKLASLESEARKLGIPKYAKTTKALRNFADAVLTYCSKLQSSEREQIAQNTVLELEGNMMPRVDNIYMGVPGRLEPLARIQLKQPFDALARLADLERHLNSRSQFIDQDQEARVQSVATNPIFQNILGRPDDLPHDGAVFFIKEGRMVRAQNSSTPIMIDVSRMNLGLGKEGSGLFRFIGQEHEIDGAAIIKLKLKNGKPIPLKGSDPSNPKFAKEVAELVGNVPEWLKVGMTFGEVMKKFTEFQNEQRAAAIESPIEKEKVD